MIHCKRLTLLSAAILFLGMPHVTFGQATEEALLLQDQIIEQESAAKMLPLKVPVAASKEAPEKDVEIGFLALASSAKPGEAMLVEWSGPGGADDGLYVYKAGGDKVLVKVPARANDFKPAIVTAPQRAGEYDLKLMSGMQILASASFSVVVGKAQIKILTPIVIAGETVSFEWDGPRNSGDNLTVSGIGNTQNRAIQPASGSIESPLSLATPAAAGKYEVRLQNSAGSVLASKSFEVR